MSASSKSDPQTQGRHRGAQVGRHGRLAHASLAAGHRDHVGHPRQQRGVPCRGRRRRGRHLERDLYVRTHRRGSRTASTMRRLISCGGLRVPRRHAQIHDHVAAGDRDPLHETERHDVAFHPREGHGPEALPYPALDRFSHPLLPLSEAILRSASRPTCRSTSSMKDRRPAPRRPAGSTTSPKNSSTACRPNRQSALAPDAAGTANAHRRDQGSPLQREQEPASLKRLHPRAGAARLLREHDQGHTGRQPCRWRPRTSRRPGSGRPGPPGRNRPP